MVLYNMIGYEVTVLRKFVMKEEMWLWMSSLYFKHYF